MALKTLRVTSTSLVDIDGGAPVHIWALEADGGAVEITADSTVIWEGAANGDQISFPRGLGPFTQILVDANAAYIHFGREAR